MKKTLLLIIAIMFAVISCEKTNNKLSTVTISVQSDNSELDIEGIDVTLRDLNGSTKYVETTDASGQATFTVPGGAYEASASTNLGTKLYNGVNTSINVTSGNDETFVLKLEESNASPIVIKELYIGGCPKDDASGTFSYDAYVILYNNTSSPVDASDVCFAFCSPFNSGSTSKYLVDGKLSYEAEGWLPAGYAIWWFDTNVIIEPYSQIVVSIFGAIDHTQTYSNSVDLSNGEYYCMYDPESGFNNTSRYPAPSAAIPASHYLKTYRYGLGNAWPLSTISPAFFILSHNDMKTYSSTTANYDYTENASLPNTKIQMDWVLDGVDVFSTNTIEKNGKRFPSAIDAGYVLFTNKLGHTVYRNVDKEATEAIEGNKDKLVYNYAGGTENEEGSTDPSGIDAEASIANGAIIIYKDTNNSSNDFHQRAKASLRK